MYNSISVDRELIRFSWYDPMCRKSGLAKRCNLMRDLVIGDTSDAISLYERKEKE